MNFMVSFWSVRLFFFVFQGMIGSWMSLPSTRWGFHRIFVFGDGLFPIIVSKIVRTLKLYFMRVIKYESPDMTILFFFSLFLIVALWHCWHCALDCQVVMLDLCELWRLGVEYMPQLQMYEEWCCKFKKVTLKPHFATCQMVCPLSFMGSKIDIYIYT